MGMRRRAREKALQFLYQHDMNPPESLVDSLDHFFESQRLAALAEVADPSNPMPDPPPPPTSDDAALRLFAERLIRGVLENQNALDAEIQKHAHNWDLRRMAAVDRNILRLAAYEMRFRTDIPPVVSINEAVEIAKRFSTPESGKFVNGILDRIKGDLLRPLRSGVES
ncbi:MAG: transcription antitermination factor NusB [Verrucomicrobia bacterium]|nr:transcription antitermination factor NusB [Verrucomicrobiota bacterium]